MSKQYYRLLHGANISHVAAGFYRGANDSLGANVLGANVPGTNVSVCANFLGANVAVGANMPHGFAFHHGHGVSVSCCVHVPHGVDVSQGVGSPRGVRVFRGVSVGLGVGFAARFLARYWVAVRVAG